MHTIRSAAAMLPHTCTYFVRFKPCMYLAIWTTAADAPVYFMLYVRHITRVQNSLSGS